jgi:Copper type II ascorbate-dependent monooxygenase, N-terminal domain
MGSLNGIAGFILLLGTWCFTVHALDPTGKYSQGPVGLGDKAKLWYDVDFKAKTASLALKVADPAFVKSTAEPNWIGLGVAEPSSGSMLGADIITVEFAAGQTDKCVVKDRFVPFAAFPLIDSKTQSPAVYPKEDTCQGDGSWNLIRCVRDPKTAEMVMEVTRPLDAHDVQDRAIGPNQQNLIFAYGSSFGYHGSTRGSKQISLYDSQGAVVKPTAIAPLPADVTANQSFTTTQYSVPSDDDTTYVCTSFIADLGANERRMVVAAESLLQAKSGKNLVHHLVVHACADSAYFRGFQRTQRCGYKTDTPGPAGYGNCSNVIFACT